MSKTYHFVYKTTNTINQKYYYGKHSAKSLYDSYFGSGKVLWNAIRKYNKENFKREVLKCFNTEKEAYEHEKKLLTNKVLKDPNCYNIVAGGEGNWYRTQTVKDKLGNTYIVSSEDPRYLSGELVHIFVGTTAVKDKQGNMFNVSLEDPRYLSGELVGVLKDCVTVKDKYGNTESVSVSDPRYLSGELVHHFTGTISVKDKTGKMFHVDKNDPRWISGELVGLRKGGKATTQNKRGITNGLKDQFIDLSKEEIPEGWWLGSHMKGKKEHLKKGKPGTTTGKKAVTNGSQYKYISPTEIPPEGWWWKSKKKLKEGSII